MNVRAPWTIASVCLALAAVCGYQLIAPPPAYSVPNTSTPALPELPPAPPPFLAPPADAFAVVSDRPLFDPARKKYVRPVTVAPDKPPPPPNLMLVGVIIDGQHRIAMVKASEGALASSVGIGTQVGGWEVSAVEPDRLVLKVGSTEAEIRLDANKAAPTSIPSQAGSVPAGVASTQTGLQQPQGSQQQSTP